MVTRILIASAVLVLALAGVMNGADFSVVPGERMGAIKLGMSFAEAAKILMQFGTIGPLPTPYGQAMCNTEPNVGFCIADFVLGPDDEVTKQDGVVLIVGTDDKRFRLAFGPKVGDSLEDFTRILGPSEANVDGEWHFWMSKGFKLVVEGDEVQAVFVFKAK